jgi:hypothetical protein
VCGGGSDRLKGPVVTDRPRGLDTQVQDKRAVAWDRRKTAAGAGQERAPAAPPPFPKRPEYEEKARRRVSQVRRAGWGRGGGGLTAAAAPQASRLLRAPAVPGRARALRA